MCQASEHVLLNRMVKVKYSKNFLDSNNSNYCKMYLKLEIKPETLYLPMNIVQSSYGSKQETDNELLVLPHDINVANINDASNEDCKDDAFRDVDGGVECNDSESENAAEVEDKKTILTKKPKASDTHKSLLLLKERPIKKEKRDRSDSKRRKKNSSPLRIMCEICGNMYYKQSLLNLHMRRHLAVKPFSCE